MAIDRLTLQQVSGSSRFEEERKYWTAKSQEEDYVFAALPLLQLEKADFKEGFVDFRFPDSVSMQLLKIAGQNDYALFTILLAGVSLFHYRISGDANAVFGTPVFIREYEEGLLNNVIPLFTRVGRQAAFREYLQILKGVVREGQKYQNYPYRSILQPLETKEEGQLSTYLYLENIQHRAFIPNGYKLIYQFRREADGITGRILFDAGCYEASVVETVPAYIGSVIGTMLGSIGNTPGSEFLGADMFSRLSVVQGQESEIPMCTVIDLFRSQVNAHPDTVAIVDEGIETSYSKLDGMSDALAASLAEKGLKKGSVAGLCFPRSLEYIVSAMAVMKCGAAFLPIDAESPSQRISYLLRDSGAKMLLASGSHSVEDFEGDVLVYSDALLESRPGSFTGCRPSDTAYVIYTSGSTGQPKGVKVSHQNIVNLAAWFNDIHDLSRFKRVLNMTSIAFDVSIEEILVLLMFGAAVFPVRDEVLFNKHLFADFVNANGIQMAQFVPVTLKELIAGNRFMPSLEVVICGGEKLDIRLKESVLAMGYHLFNHYGPTECTVDAIAGSCDMSSEAIGKPVHNTALYILNQENRILPHGFCGEIGIAGAAVSQGYLGRPELNAERFITFSAGEEPVSLYKTGDIGYIRPDGRIYIIGRRDEQVKLHGHRIELGEIEAAVKRNSAAREVIAAIKTVNGSKVLTAYYTGQESLDELSLRKKLEAELPAYMIPAYFVQLDKVPYTVNRKVDRNALPKPEEHGRLAYTAPQDDTQKTLCEIWEEVTGFERVGIHQNFFSLGGDSIKAMQVSARLFQRGLKAEIRDLFRYHTIAELSPYVKKAKSEVSQSSVEGEVPLTPIQQWFFGSGFGGQHHYNQSVLLFSKERFNETVLDKVFLKLYEHHDALRTVFRTFGSVVKQLVIPFTETKWDLPVYFDCNSPEQVTMKCSEIQASINLETGPLMKTALFRCPDGDHLLIVVHHLVVDGVSWRILFEDFSALYTHIRQGKEAVLPFKTTSYKDWANGLILKASLKSLKKELPVWKSIEEQEFPKLPKDRTISQRLIATAATVNMQLDKEATSLLLSRANEAYGTEINDILLTALYLAVAEYTGSGKVLISLEGHGREEGNAKQDLTRTVGWFTSLFPVGFDADPAAGLGAVLCYVKETLRRIPSKGSNYGVLKYIAGPRDSFKSNPEISFNYLGRFDEDIDTEVFTVSPVHGGEMISRSSFLPNSFDFNALISDGSFTIGLTYSNDEFDASTIEKILASYLSHLKNIIEHCASCSVKTLTPSDFGDPSLDVSGLEHIYSMVGRDIRKIYELTPMQKGMLFHAGLDPSSEAYFEQLDICITGPFSLESFRKSMQALTVRYETLRTLFVHGKLKEPRQVVLSSLEVPVEYIDARSTCNPEEEAQRIKKDDIGRGFDLSREAMRVTIVRVAEDRYHIIWSHHHALMDGWCMSLVMMDFFRLYKAALSGAEADLGHVFPYSDYIYWLRSQDSEEGTRYWKEYLDDFEGYTSFPRGSTGQEAQKKDHVCRIDTEASENLNQLASQLNVTLNVLFQAAWGLLLQRYSNGHDAVFGTVVSGRPAELTGSETMVGLFINALPVRCTVSGSTTAEEYIKATQERFLASSHYQYLPLSDIQNLSLQKQSLVDNLLIFENFPVARQISEDAKDSGLFEVQYIDSFEQTNYDLTLMVMPAAEITTVFKYNSAVYSDDFIKGLGEQLFRVLSAFSAREKAVSEIQITGADKYYALKGPAAPLSPCTFAESFERVAYKTPSQPAFTVLGKSYDYSWLNTEANKIANYLRSRMPSPANQPVGVMMQRSKMLLPVLLGIIKSGACYVPIDPEFPAGRISYIIQDSGIRILFTDEEPAWPVPVEIISPVSHAVQAFPPTDPVLVSNSDDVLYITYTSGSTGKPKGVMVQHRNVLQFSYNLRDVFGISNADRMLAVTNITFDISVLELLCTLLNGTHIILAAQEELMLPSALSALVQDHAVSALQLTPSRLRVFLEILPKSFFEGLSCLLIGGEALPEDLYRRVRSWKPRVFNVYGPTETTIWSTAELLNNAPLSIGLPLPGESIYILDDHGHVQPFGAAGEICIAGTGVAKGYLHNEELTAQRFISMPGCEGPLYRTGDLGLIQNGALYFRGRKDDQVKLRGYRIETGEIEAAIKLVPGIEEAVVALKNVSGKEEELIAYYKGAEMKDSDLAARLSGSLPMYMIPASFVKMDQFPHTPGGKLDKKSLPLPASLGKVSAEHASPLTELEKRLAVIWEDILEVENIGVDDNFFERGGHSLKALSLISRVSSEFSIDIPLMLVFKFPTIRTFAASFSADLSSINLSEAEQAVSLLNGKHERNIFFFPPAAAYAITYKPLASYLDNHSVHGFNFIESDSRLDEYMRIINSIQPEGPLVLFAYSAGGVLAFELVKHLEKHGRAVSELVLLDAWRRLHVQEVTREQKNEALLRYFEDTPEGRKYFRNEGLKQMVKKKIESYFDYFIGTVNTGMIRADIHFIHAETREIEDGDPVGDWKASTAGTVHAYSGSGNHQDMVFGANLERNGKLLNKLLGTLKSS